MSTAWNMGTHTWCCTVYVHFVFTSSALCSFCHEICTCSSLGSFLEINLFLRYIAHLQCNNHIFLFDSLKLSPYKKKEKHGPYANYSLQFLICALQFCPDCVLNSSYVWLLHKCTSQEVAALPMFYPNHLECVFVNRSTKLQPHVYHEWEIAGDCQVERWPTKCRVLVCDFSF